MPGDPDAAVVDQVVKRVERGIEAGADAAVLLRRVIGAGRAAGPRVVGRAGRGEGEVERVLGPVVEGPALLGGNAVELIDSGAEGVAAALPLRVVGEDDVAVLGEGGGLPPVELLGGLDGAVRDHDQRPLGRPVLGRPDVPGEGRAVARREQHRLDDPEAGVLPVVEADVAGAFLPAVGADVAAEVALRISRGDLGERGEVVHVGLRQPRLELGRQRHVLIPLGGLREVLRLERRVERLSAGSQRQRAEGGQNRTRSQSTLGSLASPHAAGKNIRRAISPS